MKLECVHNQGIPDQIYGEEKMDGATLDIKSPVGRAPLVPGAPLLGSLLPYRKDMLSFLSRSRADLGDVFRIHLGGKVMHVFSHPDIAEQVLIKERALFGKFQEFGGPAKGLSLVLGRGLVTNYGEAWQRQRQMIQPMFHKGLIAKMAGTMTEAGERLLAEWHENIKSGQHVDIAQEMMRVTVDIVSKTMFSADVTGKVDLIASAFPLMLRYVFDSLSNPLLLPLRWPTPRNLAVRRARSEFDRLIYHIIDTRKREHAPRGDLLDMLLNARYEDTGGGMPLEQLRDEIATIFAAGHETTANGLSWTWHMLAGHPDVRNRLHAELDQVLGGRTPCFDDLPDLPYTRAVFEEVMRLYPPAPVIFRVVLSDTTVRGYPLRRGDLTMTNAYQIHHHPDFWAEPEKFNPDRFMPVNSEGPQHRCAYMPFGAGPRICIGNHFALMEGQLLLAQIAQVYDISPVAGHPVEREVAVTMRPKYGLMMTLTPRHPS